MFNRAIDVLTDRDEKAAEKVMVVAGLVDDNEVSILSTWSDRKNTWAKLDKGCAVMMYDGETYIQPA